MFKRILKILGIVLGIIILAAVVLVIFLSLTEYRPAERQPADRIAAASEADAAGQSLTIYSWNIGYGGLGKESDFFMDGGRMVYPPSAEITEKNLTGIANYIQKTEADVWLLQEVDINSARTNAVDEYERLRSAVPGSAAFAYNYNCPFVPIPLPPMGRVESGLTTLTSLAMEENAERISLPCPFSWPVRAANIKRCLLVTRTPVENSDKELVLVNLHLEAYESGEGRIAQTKQLLEFMEAEYQKGNYVIAGGDFNQTFPDSLDQYPIADTEKWTPGVLDAADLPNGWQFAYDCAAPTCRLLDQPYCDACQLYVIDGFILSPNVQLDHVETVSLDFEYSDHNPVCLQISLMP